MNWKKKLKKNKNFKRSSTPASQKLELGPKDPYHLIVQVHRSKRPRKKKVRMGEIKGEEVCIKDQGAIGPNPPQWQDSHTGKGGNRRQFGKPSTKYQISHSPFSKEIEGARLPGNFSPPNYVMYDCRTDPIGHFSHFRQSMALHLNNDTLMCRMFPSSLGPMSLRWFNRLQHSSIRSWDELAKAFVSRFITNSRTPKEFDSLMSMRMKDMESLKNYSSRYWEVYNKVDGGTEDMTITTFKQGLDPESKLRHSLSKRPAKNMRDLMSWIQQYVRVEEDRVRTRVTSAPNRPPRKIANTEPKRAEQPPRNPTRFPWPRELGRVYTVFNIPISKSWLQ